MASKKIVFSINDFTVGGAQNQLLRQFPLYDQEKFSIYLLILIHNTAKNNLIQYIPDYINVKTFHFRSFVDVRSWINLFSYLNDLKPDLVITSLFFSNTVIRVLKIFLGFRVVAREHNTYDDKKTWQIITDFFLSFFTEKIVAVSQEVADFASKQANIKKTKFFVIENGIDLSTVDTFRANFDASAFKKKLGLDAKERIFLNVARLVEQKNQSLLIEGFSKYVLNNPAHLIIVGDGPMRKELESLTETLDIKNRVLFVGEQANTNPYYLIADALLSTSVREGMSNAHLEAAANGLPIITTKTGGTKNIIRPGWNGILIEEQTPNGVCTAIENADKLKFDYLAKNMWSERQRFDIKTTVRKYEELFVECMR